MIIVYVPTPLSEAELAANPKAVIVWEEVYRSDDWLAVVTVAEWHENVGIRTLTCEAR